MLCAGCRVDRNPVGDDADRKFNEVHLVAVEPSFFPHQLFVHGLPHIVALVGLWAKGQRLTNVLMYLLFSTSSDDDFGPQCASSDVSDRGLSPANVPHPTTPESGRTSCDDSRAELSTPPALPRWAGQGPRRPPLLPTEHAA